MRLRPTPPPACALVRPSCGGAQHVDAARGLRTVRRDSLADGVCSAATPSGSGDAIGVPVPGAPRRSRHAFSHCGAARPAALSPPFLTAPARSSRPHWQATSPSSRAKSRAPKAPLPPVPPPRSARAPAGLDRIGSGGGRRRDSSVERPDPATRSQDPGESHAVRQTGRHGLHQRRDRRGAGEPRVLRLGVLHHQHQLGRPGRTGRARAPGSTSATSTSTRTSRAPAARRSPSARSRSTTTRCRRSTGTGSRGFDYVVDADWGVTVTAPGVDRDHTHIHNHRGQQLVDTGTSLRSATCARWVAIRFAVEERDPDAPLVVLTALLFGLKLPTGNTDVATRRAAGRAQPAAGNRHDGRAGRRLFPPGAPLPTLLVLQAVADLRLSERAIFPSGQRASRSTWATATSGDKLGLMLQLNLLYKGRDRARTPSRRTAAGRFVFVSPGRATFHALRPGVRVIRRPLTST